MLLATKTAYAGVGPASSCAYDETEIKSNKIKIGKKMEYVEIPFNLRTN
jgi:hypothetical protein